MTELHIDIETYSSVNLADCGVYKYADAEDFAIILLAYKCDNNPTQVVDLLRGETIPPEIIHALFDPRVIKIAHNAVFEIVCLSRHLGYDLDPLQWRCTMVMAAFLGLPFKLETVAQVLKLPIQKDSKGKALIKYFCEPCKPTKVNGGRTRNLPIHAPDKWQAFKSYNITDVDAECGIYDYCVTMPGITRNEWELWALDQEINGRGILLDAEFITAAIRENEDFVATVQQRLRDITGLENPNSLTQLKNWIESITGKLFGSMAKNAITDALNCGYLPKKVKEVLTLRQLASKTSAKKYDRMLKFMRSNGRACGTIQYYGANRTGRYAGRGVQPHNMKRSPKKNIDRLRDSVLYSSVSFLEDDPSEVISQLIRTAIIAPPGSKLIACDFSAIEGRVLSWLAGEEWKLEVFRTHGKIYEAAAAAMFGIPLESIGKESDERQKGKVAELALGYQGGTGALITMGALRDGIPEDELQPIVNAWRRSNQRIKKLWYDVENAAKKAINEGRKIPLKLPYTELYFSMVRGYLVITLPSGRNLFYYGAGLSSGKYGDQVTFFGMDQVKKIWTRQTTYGGSLVENIVQAIARDCLTECLQRMAHLRITMHVHDEIVVEAKDSDADATLKEMQKIMALPPIWALDLPIKGEGFISNYYKK